MAEHRTAGDVEAYVDHARRIVDLPLEQAPPVEVACDGCVACCYSKRIEFDPTQEQPENLPHLRYTLTDGGIARLDHRPDGGCTHLGERGCMVYARRPLPCRAFDCRAFSLLGITADFGDGRHPPHWAFERSSKRGHLLAVALQVLSMACRQHAADAGVEIEPADVVEFAFEELDAVYSKLEAATAGAGISATDEN